jgi:hypothetical protein
LYATEHVSFPPIVTSIKVFDFELRQAEYLTAEGVVAVALAMATPLLAIATAETSTPTFFQRLMVVPLLFLDVSCLSIFKCNTVMNDGEALQRLVSRVR